jgi:putative transcriptional regulator
MKGKNTERPRTAPTAGGRTQEVDPGPANKVAAARQCARLSQQALADQIGVGRQSIARIEGGRQTPSVAMAIAISKAVGEPVEALFGGDR